jgi:hypothetical protein
MSIPKNIQNIVQSKSALRGSKDIEYFSKAGGFGGNIIKVDNIIH